MGRLLSLYHHLPPPLRSLTASLRGLYLRSWRYGPETERLVNEAHAHENWSPEQWKAWQEERLAFILHRAATKVPYYRQQWESRRIRGDQASWEVLQNWPILEKNSIRQNPAAFVADDCDTRHMFHEHTSGTTGKPLDLWWGREMVRTWYALVEARWRLWYGVSRHDRWAIVGGQLVVPFSQKRPPFWVWNAAMHQLYLSAYHLSPSFIPAYIQALHHYRITYLWGYPSALYALAREIHRKGCPKIPMKVVITNAEPLYLHQKSAIEEAFACPVRETYGMTEAVAAAGECPSGNLHFWPEVGLVEVLHNDQPVPEGEFGELICTGLLNPDMPLIRYRVGDRGAFCPSDSSCPCGRRLPLMQGIEGRQDDVLYTPDGRRIGRLDPVFKTQLPVEEAQIVQETLNRIRIRYVPAPDFNESAKRSLIDRLQERMGNTEVVLEPVASIERGSNGKFRAVICQIPPEERPQ